MKTKISSAKDSKEVPVLPDGVFWEGILKALKEEKGQQFLKTIDPATFKYILEEGNHTKAIQSLLKTLKKIDPQNANEEYAEMTLGAMQKVAQIHIEK
jgi:rhamnogalacturonyl hydrolase YesR